MSDSFTILRLPGAARAREAGPFALAATGADLRAASYRANCEENNPCLTITEGLFAMAVTLAAQSSRSE